MELSSVLSENDYWGIYVGEFACKSAHSGFKVTHMTSYDLEGQQ